MKVGDTKCTALFARLSLFSRYVSITVGGSRISTIIYLFRRDCALCGLCPIFTATRTDVIGQTQGINLTRKSPELKSSAPQKRKISALGLSSCQIVLPLIVLQYPRVLFLCWDISRIRKSLEYLNMHIKLPLKNLLAITY